MQCNGLKRPALLDLPRAIRRFNTCPRGELLQVDTEKLLRLGYVQLSVSGERRSLVVGNGWEAMHAQDCVCSLVAGPA